MKTGLNIERGKLMADLHESSRASHVVSVCMCMYECVCVSGIGGLESQQPQRKDGSD